LSVYYCWLFGLAESIKNRTHKLSRKFTIMHFFRPSGIRSAAINLKPPMV